MLTIIPDDGHKLVSIHVYHYGTKTAVPLTDPTQIRAGGTVHIRTFTMSAGHVTVVAVFRLIGSVSVVETAVRLYRHTQKTAYYMSAVCSQCPNRL